MVDEAIVPTQGDTTTGTQTDTGVKTDVNPSAEGTTSTDTTGLGAEAKEGDETTTGLGETVEEVWAKDYVGKPEEGYDYKEILPEGWALNEELAGKFNDIAGKYNMANKGASEIMALAVDLAKQTQDGVLSAQLKAVEANRIKYSEAVTNDAEIGGAKLDETMKTANVAYNHFIQSDKEAHEIFCQTGLNTHPAVVKMFHAIGKQMQDDSIHQAGSQSGEKKTAAQTLFGNTTQNKGEK